MYVSKSTPTKKLSFLYLGLIENFKYVVSKTETDTFEWVELQDEDTCNIAGEKCAGYSSPPLPSELILEIVSTTEPSRFAALFRDSYEGV